MSFTLGRASFSNSSLISDIQISGDQVTVTFEIVGSTVDEMKALRQQVTGLVDNRDEEVVPFTWSEDPSNDGFYTVNSVTVPSAPVFLVNGYIPGCQIQMTKVTGFSNAWFEVSTLGVVRPNTLAVTQPGGIYGVVIGQSAATAYPESFAPFSIGTSTQIARLSEGSATANGVIWTTPGAVSWPFGPYTFQYGVQPANFYSSACKVEVLYGATWYTVTGRQTPYAQAWRISNGMVRLTSARGATPGTIEVWDGTQWESTSIGHYDQNVATAYDIGGGVPGATAKPSMTILRNSPEQVIVRSHGFGQFSYSLGRGARHVAIEWATQSAFTWNMGIRFMTATASTTMTGGIRATSNDANGNRVVFGVPVTATRDLVNGIIGPSGGSLASSMMVGVALNGSAAIAGDTEVDLIQQWLAAMSWRQRVVVR